MNLDTHTKSLKKYKLNVRLVNASNMFLEKTAQDFIDPEKKRKIIGELICEDYFEKEAQKDIKNVKYLGQGTLYPDIIESRSAPQVIAKL